MDDIIEPNDAEKQLGSDLKILEEIKNKLQCLDDIKLQNEEGFKKIQKENDSQISKVVNFYNTTSIKAQQILEKLDKEVTYRDKLQAELDKRRAEADSLELKNALAQTYANIDSSVENIKREMKSNLERIDNREQVLIENIQSKVEELKSLEVIIDDAIKQYRKDMTEAGNREYKILRSKCEEHIKECNDRIEEIKKNTIDFLNICQRENEKIIAKIPEQKISYNKKDFIFYGIAFLSSVNLLIQMIFRLR